MIITVQRKTDTADGIFGTLSLDWNPFTCVTLENKAMALQAGTWPLTYAFSPHFNRQMPLINVPHRTWTWFHWANWPQQLEGCIALGSVVDGDAIDQSVATWNQFWEILNNQPDIQVKIIDIA